MLNTSHSFSVCLFIHVTPLPCLFFLNSTLGSDLGLSKLVALTTLSLFEAVYLEGLSWPMFFCIGYERPFWCLPNPVCNVCNLIADFCK